MCSAGVGRAVDPEPGGGGAEQGPVHLAGRGVGDAVVTLAPAKGGEDAGLEGRLPTPGRPIGGWMGAIGRATGGTRMGAVVFRFHEAYDAFCMIIDQVQFAHSDKKSWTLKNPWITPSPTG